MKQPTVVSLFSGCGGMDLGFKQAGFDITWANDFFKDAVITYKKNIGDHIRFGEPCRFSVNITFDDDSFEHVFLVIPIQNGKAGSPTDLFRVYAEDAVSYRVKGAAPNSPGIAGD